MPTPIVRNRLLWIGEDPTAGCEEACKIRGLMLDQIGQAGPNELRYGKGLILSVATAADFAEHAQKLPLFIQHGVSVVVLSNLDDIDPIGGLLLGSGMKGHVTQKMFSQEAEAIESIARTPLMPGFNPALVIKKGEGVTREDEILLRRAFYDCVDVALEPQAGGSAKVFRAFAHLGDSRAGPLPLPFFVKFDKREKIERELDNYAECTTLHIPFNQRPNLDSCRCALGKDRGVIVGNFVDQSESLQNVVDARGGQNPLHSLFEGALGGWRRQVFYNETKYTANAKVDLHSRLLLPSSFGLRRRGVLQGRFQRLKGKGKVVTAPEALDDMLRALPPIRYRWSMTHGDLHGENVRVSGNDAILIDFASSANGPLTIDPACLDVSLMLGTVTIFSDDWMKEADRLYALETLKNPPTPPVPHHQASTLFNALYYLRQVGRSAQLDGDDYPRAVALQLLRKASYPGGVEGDLRRDFAYLLADRLIKSLSTRVAQAA